MKVWKFICLLTVGLFITVICLYIHHVNLEQRYYIHTRTDEIGRNLIETTNSKYLEVLNPEFRDQLSKILRSPTHVSEVQIIEPKWFWQRTSDSHLTLKNSDGENLLLSLHDDENATNWDGFIITDHRMTFPSTHFKQ